MLSNNLEKTLRDAYQIATINKHEFVTLEHLLCALIDDEEASEVLLSCNVDIEEFVRKHSMDMFEKEQKKQEEKQLLQEDKNVKDK